MISTNNSWEQRQLRDLVTYRRGSFPQPYGLKQWYGGKGAQPFVQVADVNDDLKLNEETNQTISVLAQPMSIFVPKGSVIVTLQGTIGRVAFTHYNAYFDRTILIFDQYKEKLDKYFWCLTIQNKFIDEAKRAPGGTIKTITKEALSDFELKYPKLEEQEKLGFLFKTLNCLTTLHQREQIYKINGVKTKITLFIYSWEQRELASLIVKGGSGGTPSTSNPNYYLGTIPFLSITDITNSDGYIYDTEKHITEEALNNSAAWIVPSESISLAMYASVGKVAILKQNTATSQAFYNLVINGIGLRNYLFQYLKKMESLDEWTSLVSTGTQANLNAEKVKELIVNIPTKKEEQSKVGDLLLSLDQVITLHQREQSP